MSRGKEPTQAEESALNIRRIPREMFYRLKIAAAVEHKTVRDFIMGLVEARLEEMEKKGMLPKGKS
jgi:hypothetical protein